LDETNSAGRPVFSWLADQPDVTFIAHDSQGCPPCYVMSITNTNLFSPSERAFLEDIWQKYRSTNYNMFARARNVTDDGYDVAFTQTHEWRRGKMLKDGTAEDEILTNDFLLKVQQIQHGQLNGLRIEFYGLHGGSLLHFKDNMAVGDWCEWAPDGNLQFAAKFNKPYLLFGEFLYERGYAKPPQSK
jgi:hypothetical protein